MSHGPEYEIVEKPLIDQLVGLGWTYIEGDVHVPYLTERESFRQVILPGRLRNALRQKNLDQNSDEWLDDARINKVVDALERLGATKLMEANQAATELLLTGVPVEGLPGWDGGRDQNVHFIDFDHPERNDFLVVNQFRVDLPGGRGYVVPDVVLFVNGIPLVVIECKSPYVSDPMGESIAQLFRYSEQHEFEGGNCCADRLFHYNQLMIGTCFEEARAATVGAYYDHFMQWKDPAPLSREELARQLNVEPKALRSQQTLVAGMLRPATLLDLVRNFTVYKAEAGRTIKIVARYQQYRAVEYALQRLRTGQTRRQHGEYDQRGGIVWHTQGSGKSLTMVFLVRKMRTLPDLRRFKVVVVTDRKDLQKQLSATAALTGESVRVAKSVKKAQQILAQEMPDLVFVTIQKYQPSDEQTDQGVEVFPVLNESEDVLVLVDEAHRSQSSDLHANLLRGLPNCARIGFTGTPILMGDRKRTHEIFGPFIDRYTIKQSEQDGSTVPILYEGHKTEMAVDDGRTLDQLFDDGFAAKTVQERAEIQRRFVTASRILEAEDLIAAKARDMVRHFVATSLPEGFKAMVVGSSRLAAIRYQREIASALAELIAEVEGVDQSTLDLPEDVLELQSEGTQFLVRAHALLPDLRRLEAAAVISGAQNDDPTWSRWSDGNRQDTHIERFKKPLRHTDLSKADGLAFLCVKSMLLTGFDAPKTQIMYLDRPMHSHELLQAIARVNRTVPGKDNGLVVDYVGIAKKLSEALAVYSAEEVDGAMTSVLDEVPKLRDRHRRVVDVFASRGVDDLDDVEACLTVLEEVKVRAEFMAHLKLFLVSMGIVLPRPEALPFVKDMKRLGRIRLAAANRFRDYQLNLLGAAQKVRHMIDRHLVSLGIDPYIPAVSVTDEDFEAEVARLASPRAKASEMEHAVRHHIRVHLQEDPVRYRKLSERLEEILATFADRWDDLLAQLEQLTREVSEGRSDAPAGLNPQTQAPFLDILAEEAVEGAELLAVAEATVALVEHMREDISSVDFWRNAHAQDLLRGWVVQFLDDRDLVPFAKQRAVADRLLELAKALHVRLTAS